MNAHRFILGVSRCLGVPLAFGAALIAAAPATPTQTGGAPPPVVRVIKDYDGRPSERIRGQGTLTVCHDPRFVRDGLGSLRVAPGKGRFWGVTLTRVPAHGARALLADLHHTGERPAWLLLKIEDVRTKDRKNRFVRRIDVKPGWNRMEVDLRDAATENGRRLDFGKPLNRIIIDRGGPKDAFYIDHLRFLLDPPASVRKLRARFLRRFRGDDEAERVRAVQELRFLSETERVKLLLKALKPTEPVWIVEAIVRELERSEDPASWGAIRQRSRRAGPALRARFVELLGAAKVASVRQDVVALAADAGTPAGIRVVALRAAARRGRADLLSIVGRLAPDAPWALRAAGVVALRLSRAPEAVDLLIKILERPGNARVELDAYEALVDLTGMDYGYELIQWKGWWLKHRDGPLPPPARGKVKHGGGYATYYGIPVRGSRVVFILDISGSMRQPISSHKARVHIEESDHLRDRKLETRLDLAKEELIHTLGQLPPTTVYNVGFFNDEVFWLHREMVEARPANVKETGKRVRRMSAEQGTNVYEAIRQSIDAAWFRTRTGHEAGPDTIFLLSDGVPSVGRITRFGHLADWAYHYNLPRFVRLNTILVGPKGHGLLRRLARESSGVFVDVGG